jgi:hypothetical protein
MPDAALREMPMARRLEIFVLPDCLGCETAVHLAHQVGALNMDRVEVRIIDLSVPGAVKPATVFAVPTYLLDGELLSLGNPDERWLLDQLEAGPTT